MSGHRTPPTHWTHTAVDSHPQLLDLAEGLKRMGYTRAESVSLLEAAMEEFIYEGNSAPSEEDLLLRALRLRGASLIR